MSIPTFTATMRKLAESTCNAEQLARVEATLEHVQLAQAVALFFGEVTAIERQPAADKVAAWKTDGTAMRRTQQARALISEAYASGLTAAQTPDMQARMCHARAQAALYSDQTWLEQFNPLTAGVKDFTQTKGLAFDKQGKATQPIQALQFVPFKGKQATVAREQGIITPKELALVSNANIQAKWDEAAKLVEEVDALKASTPTLSLEQAAQVDAMHEQSRKLEANADAQARQVWSTGLSALVRYTLDHVLLPSEANWQQSLVGKTLQAYRDTGLLPQHKKLGKNASKALVAEREAHELAERNAVAMAQQLDEAKRIAAHNAAQNDILRQELAELMAKLKGLPAPAQA